MICYADSVEPFTASMATASVYLKPATGYETMRAGRLYDCTNGARTLLRSVAGGQIINVPRDAALRWAFESHVPRVHSDRRTAWVIPLVDDLGTFWTDAHAAFGGAQ